MSVQPSPDPQAVERALAYLREHGRAYTREALGASLQEQGFSGRDVEAAWARYRAEQAEPRGAGRDLRGRASIILLVAFVGTWAVLSLPMLTGSSLSSYGAGTVATAILTFLLGVVLVASLSAVRRSRRLERGVEGALVAILAVPFVLLFVVAGLCVATVNPFRS
jgi:hypothetical protein